MSVIKISAGTYTPDISISVIFCDTTKGEINIILPNIQDSQLDRKEGYEFFIVDTSDNASNNNIILTGININSQQVNSKDRIVLAQDGVVATLKPASYLDWVCNISSMEAQQVSGLSSIGKTNVISYTTPSSKLIQQERSREIIVPFIPPYVVFDNILYSNINFLCNIGNDNEYFVYEIAVRKGEVAKAKYLLFKRLSETAMGVVDLYEGQDISSLRYDYLNSTTNGFYTTSIFIASEKESRYLFQVNKNIFTVKNDKLVNTTRTQSFDILTLFNKYTNLNITLVDDAFFEMTEILYSDNNNSNAMITGGKYGGYLYFNIIAGKGREFTPLEKLDNIIGVNLENVTEVVAINMFTDLTLNTDYTFNPKDLPNVDKQANFLLINKQWTPSTAGLIFNLTDGFAVVTTGVTPENSLQGLTSLYCPQNNKKKYLTIEQVGYEDSFNPLVTQGKIESPLKNNIFAPINKGFVFLYPSIQQSLKVANSTNIVGVVYNMETLEVIPFNTPIKGIEKTSITSISFLTTNFGLLYDVNFEGQRKQNFYSKGTNDAVYVDSLGNTKSVETSPSGIISYNSFTNNSAISVSNDGVSLKGLQILEDVFQNINNFNS